jgi:FkbM family methyltransferase
MKKTILIAVPTNKYIEPETMKSIYDLIIPEGYTTELQFYHGYQVDQIRNLTAEWGKHYDYMFCVDSDIILPRETLVKFLNADKDVISGMYIQRKPGEHILEIYQDTATGGVENIPLWAIEGLETIPIAACGFGCVLIKSEVLRRMEYPHFYYQSALDHSNTVSEDVYFCMKARSLGFEIWCDTEIRCEHIGSTKFTVHPSAKSIAEQTANQDLLVREHADYLKIINAQPQVIYDIGASMGHWTKKAKEVWPNAEYYLFDAEPISDNVLSRYSHNVAIEVLSDQDGKTVEFYRNPYNPAGNSYYQENTNYFDQTTKTLRTTRTIDSIIEEGARSKPDLVKIDVQGAELDVLKGMSKTLSNCKDIIVQAQHQQYNLGAPQFDEVHKYLTEIGFQLIAKICEGEVDAEYHFKKQDI